MIRTLGDVRKKISSHRYVLEKKYNVKRLGVFGSYVHDSQTDSSDIDILVEFDKPIGWEIVDLQLYLEEILGKNVDLVTIRSLRPELREIILRDVVYT
jgi:hypothetical protein